MSRPVSLSSLMIRVRRRLNAENMLKFIRDDELIDNISESAAELYDLLRAQYGQDYYIAQYSFQTSPGTRDYALPGNCAAFKGLDVVFGQNIVITARPYVWSERNRYKWYPGWIYSQPVFYRMVGNWLRLIPDPNGVYSCILFYVPAAPQLAAPQDTFDAINGWEEYVVLDAAIKCLLKSERFDLADRYTARLAEIKQRIRGLAGNRDAENPERVQDVSLNDGWIGRPGY
jgi:hypothetical protein